MPIKETRQAPEGSLVRRFLRSIFPGPVLSANARQRPRFFLRNLALHFRPTAVPEKTLRLSLTWGLGGMAAVLVFLQFGTGVLLKFFYEPTPVAAYGSVQTVITTVPFGKLVRNMHHWGAHLLVAVVFLHMLRVFFTGAFHPPRQFNWVVGLALFATVLAANLTGYLLPWDQLAYWAVTVSTGMLEYVPAIGPFLQETIRGGAEIGPATLKNFFALHTAVAPAVLIGLMAFHFWRVRKAGGLVVPRKPEKAPDPHPARAATVPNLLVRELAAALAATAVLTAAAVFFDAPLLGQANPGLSPNPTRAPWYFAGIQELLLHLHPTIAVCIVPLLGAIGLAVLPYVRYETDTGGVWFASTPGRKTAAIAAALGLLATPLLIAAGERLAATGASSRVSSIVGNALVPVVLAASLPLFHSLLRRRYSATRNDAVQALFVLVIVAYGVLTVTNVWFRGEGMVLQWPW